MLAFSYFCSCAFSLALVCCCFSLSFLSFELRCLLRLQLGAILRHRPAHQMAASGPICDWLNLVSWLAETERCVLSGVLWRNKGITAFLFGALSHTAAKEDSIRETFNAEETPSFGKVVDF